MCRHSSNRPKKSREKNATNSSHSSHSPAPKNLSSKINHQLPLADGADGLHQNPKDQRPKEKKICPPFPSFALGKIPLPMVVVMVFYSHIPPPIPYLTPNQLLAYHFLLFLFLLQTSDPTHQNAQTLSNKAPLGSETYRKSWEIQRLIQPTASGFQVPKFDCLPWHDLPSA